MIEQRLFGEGALLGITWPKFENLRDVKFDKSVCFGVLSRAEQSKGLICSKGLKAGREGGNADLIWN